MAPDPSQGSSKKHLFVVLAGPLGDEDEFLLVSLSRVQAGVPYDDTCLLDTGDHPFVKQLTYVRYDLAAIHSRAYLERAVSNGIMLVKQPVTLELYERICDGLKQSVLTPYRAKTFLLWHENACD